MELGAGFDETWGKIRWDLVQDLMELGAKIQWIQGAIHTYV